MNRKYQFDRELCFVLEPVQRSGRLSRQQLQKIYEHVIEPAIDGRGMRVVRSSSLASPHLITRQHEEHLQNAQLVIANLSGCDPIVHYCIGRRHGHAIASNQPLETGMVFLQDRLEEMSLLDIASPSESLIYYGPEANQQFKDESTAAEYISQMNIKARQDLTRTVSRLVEEQRRAAAQAADQTRDQDDAIKPLEREFIKKVVDEAAEKCAATLAAEAPPEGGYVNDLIKKMQSSL